MKPRDPSYFDTDVCKPFFHQGGETGILLLHGFTGSVAHMRPLGDALHAMGYTVMGVNLPGHATTEQDMARFGWQDWLYAAETAVDTMRERCTTVAVCGLSMGAILALLLAAEQKVDGCISISAPFPQNNKLLPLTAFLWFLQPRVAWKSREDIQEQLDPAYNKGYSGFPARKGSDLHQLIKRAQLNLSKIECPVLVVQSMADQTVAQISADDILAGISSIKKRKLSLKDVPHVCTISKELPAIAEAINALLQTL